MIAFSRIGARLLAGALLLTLLPTFARAQAAATVHPWKQTYVRRMAEEGMHERTEKRELREKRVRELRRLARELARSGKSSLRAKSKGEHARPAPHEPQEVMSIEQATRGARTFNARAFNTPLNHILNDRSPDGPQTGQSETSIAAFGDLLVAAWNDFQNFNDTQNWATSTDGGVTWVDRGTLPHAPGLIGFVWTSDPVLAVNEKTGAFYYSGLCDYISNTLGARSGIGIIKGRFNGSTFSWNAPTVARDAPDQEPDKQWIAADSSSGRVYLSYSRFPAGGSVIDFQWADSGLTIWSTPRQISLNTPAERGFVQGSRPVVDGDGRVYVMYNLIGAGFSDYYKVARSLDGGLTFAAPVVAESLYTNFGTGAPGFNRETGVQFAGLTVDRSHGPNRGRLYLSWAESINWLDEVFDIGTAGSRSEVEGNNTALTATSCVIGQTLRGTLSATSDIDMYSFTLIQGEHIVIAVDSVQSNAQDAMSLRLLASDGLTRLTFTLADFNVNALTPRDTPFPSGWMFTAPVSGTYYLRIAGVNGSGNYRVRTGDVHRNAERGRDQRDVFVAWSDDGVSWSEPGRVNEDPPGFDNWLPEVAVAPDGGVYCAWYDYRDSAPTRCGGEAGVYLARSGDGGVTWTTLGAMTDTLSNWSAALTDILPNQGDYMSLFTTSAQVHVCWSDARRGNPDVFSAAAPLIPNGAQVAFQRLRLGFNRISLDWSTSPADTLSMRLYRSTDGGAYSNIAAVTFDATGALTYADTTVMGDHVYAYRLGRFTNGIELFFGQVRLFLPSTFPISMSAPRPNPVVGSSFTASFSVPEEGPADLILHDITGREVFRQTVNLGKGPHTLTLPAGSELKQGIYVLTLRQGGRNASTRVHLVR